MFLQAVIANGQLSEMQQRFVASQKLPDDAAASEAYQGYVRIQMYNAEKDSAVVCRSSVQTRIVIVVCKPAAGSGPRALRCPDFAP
jgi:hypothetical protein